MIGDNESSFPHKLLLTNRQVANLRKAFENYLPADLKLSKTHLSKMIQSAGILGRLLGPLLKTGLPLILMSTLILALIRWLCMYKMIMLLILILLV